MIFGWHKHKRRIGGVAVIRTLATFAVAYVVGCGTSDKRAESEQPKLQHFLTLI